MDGKNITDTTKLVKELVQYLFICNSDGSACQEHILIQEGKSVDNPTNKKKS